MYAEDDMVFLNDTEWVHHQWGSIRNLTVVVKETFKPLKIYTQEKKWKWNSLFKSILEYRTTQIPGMKLSWAEILLGQPLRTTLPVSE